VNLRVATWDAAVRSRYGSAVTAQPIHEAFPDDPAEILRILPSRWHVQFLGEYRAALDAAREVQRWPHLPVLLHRWSLRAAAYTDPQFEVAMEEARNARPEDLIPVPGWPGRP
jgi:Family of unknown function (DUF6247)